MKPHVTLVTTLAVALFAVAAFAGAPLPGTYQSGDLGGTIPAGRYTEGWDAGGSAVSAGTTQNCASWDGATLGSSWRYTCGTQVAAGIVLSDNVDGNGNGNRTTACTFTGGTLWLAGNGPWAGGDSYIEYETVQYFGGVPVAAVTNVQSVAHFDHYPASCFSFSIANGTRMGTTDLGQVFPAGYPAMLDAACGATRSLGAWWTMSAVTLSINAGCTTPARHSTWGALKAIYR
jgi:hypothetical protein